MRIFPRLKKMTNYFANAEAEKKTLWSRPKTGDQKLLRLMDLRSSYANVVAPKFRDRVGSSYHEQKCGNLPMWSQSVVHPVNLLQTHTLTPLLSNDFVPPGVCCGGMAGDTKIEWKKYEALSQRAKNRTTQHRWKIFWETQHIHGAFTLRHQS